MLIKLLILLHFDSSESQPTEPMFKFYPGQELSHYFIIEHETKSGEDGKGLGSSTAEEWEFLIKKRSGGS